MIKDFWIVLPRGIARKWDVAQLTPAQAFKAGNNPAILAMCGPYRDAKEAAEAQRAAEAARVLSFARSVRVSNFTHTR